MIFWGKSKHDVTPKPNHQWGISRLYMKNLQMRSYEIKLAELEFHLEDLLHHQNYMVLSNSCIWVNDRMLIFFFFFVASHSKK